MHTKSLQSLKDEERPQPLFIKCTDLKKKKYKSEKHSKMLLQKKQHSVSRKTPSLGGKKNLNSLGIQIRM